MSAGLVLGTRYELIERLADGGFGSVWRAHDTRMDRDVAVKLLHVDGADVPRFDREARALARLNHPNIVTAHDFGVDGTTAYLVLELVHGTSLADDMLALRAVGTAGMPLSDVLDIAAQVLDGLSAAHRADVIHRDLKPQNIMRTTDRRTVKIVDFGIAHALDMPRMTTVGNIVGTLPYMAPEQLNDEPLDGRADLYALGCVLHELLTGASAFTASTPASWLNAHHLQAPARASDAVPGLPAEVDAFLHRLLAKTPADRPADAASALAELVRMRAALPVPAGEAAVPAIVVAPVAVAAGTTPAPALRSTVIRKRPAPEALAATEIRRRPAPDTPTDEAVGPGRRHVRVYAVAGTLVAGVLAAVLIVTLGTAGGSGSRPNASKGSPSASPASQPPVPLEVEPVTDLSGHTGPVDVSPDGMSVVTSGPTQNGLTRYAVSTGRSTGALANLGQHIPAAIKWSPDGARIAAVGLDRPSVLIWGSAAPTHADPLAELDTFTVSEIAIPTSVSWAPDSTEIVVGTDDGRLEIWNTAAQRLDVEVDTGSPSVKAVAWSPDGTLIASGNYDGTIALWNPATGERVRTLNGASKPADIRTGTADVRSLAWSPNSLQLVTATEDAATIWEAATGRKVRAFDAYAAPVAWSPDGTRIASAGTLDTIVHTWSVANGRDLHDYFVLRTLTAVAWSSSSLVSSDVTGHVQVWSTAA
jgi:serine/threonine-protein kinase